MLVSTIIIDHAVKYGLAEAHIINCFSYWININMKNKVNVRDGKTWTYNKISKLQELMPYLTYDQIRYALKKLRDSGVILTANYTPGDRVTWYAFVNETEFLGSKTEDEKDDEDDLPGKIPAVPGKIPAVPGKIPNSSITVLNRNINKSIKGAASASAEPEPGTDAYRDRVHALQVEALKDKNLEDFVPRGGDASQHFNAIKACLHPRASPVASGV